MALPLATQAELVSALAEETGWSKSDVKNFLNALDGVVISYLEGGNRVTISGVRIEPKVRPKSKARMGRNPATGEPVKIAAKPASVQIKARVLAQLKNNVQLPSVQKLQRMM